MENEIIIDAPLDKSVLIQQASLAYSAWEADKNGPNAKLWMGIASMLFHIHDGSLELKQHITKANLSVY